MIFFVVDFLRDILGIKMPSVFMYYSTRMILAAVTALVLSIFLGPRFIKKLYELKIGQSIRMDECPLLGQLHNKKKDTPTMGGVLILFSMLISMLMWMDFKHPFTLILFITTVCLGVLGGYDDYLKLKYKNTKGLSGKKKLLFQFLLSGLVAAYLLVPWISNGIHVGSWFAPPIVKENTIVKVNMDPYLTTEPATQNTPIVIPLSLKEYGSRIYVPFMKEPLVLRRMFFDYLLILRPKAAAMTVQTLYLIPLIHYRPRRRLL